MALSASTTAESAIYAKFSKKKLENRDLYINFAKQKTNYKILIL